MARKKSTRRGNGEGCIYRRKSGQWAAAVTLGTKPDGKPNRKFYYGKTRAEVAEKLREAINRKQEGAVDPGKITMTEWLNLWLDNYVKPNVRQSTYETYRSNMNAHLIPGIGHYQLKKLTASDIQMFFRDQLEHGNRHCAGVQGISPVTLTSLRNMLKAALEQAVLERKISINPAKQTKPPKTSKKEMNILTKAEVAQFLERAKDCRYYAAYVLAFSTGMRRGEVLGLSWDNISLDWDEIDKKIAWCEVDKLPIWDIQGLDKITEAAGVEINEPYIRISQQLTELRRGARLDIPKTETSRRIIRIPRETALTLLYQRRLQQREAARVGFGYNADNLVFCTQTGGYIEPRTFTAIFHSALKSAGLKQIRFHDIRHTVATLLIEDGAPLNAVKELLGHFDAAFTAQQYAHVTKRIQSETTHRLADIIKV